MPNDQPSARQSLADVVVRLALELERQSARRERAEALTRRARESHGDRVIGQTDVAVATRDLARERRADRAIGIGDRNDCRHALRRARAPAPRDHEHSIQSAFVLPGRVQAAVSRDDA